MAIARSTCGETLFAVSWSSHPPIAQLAVAAPCIAIGHALPRQQAGMPERDAQRSVQGVNPKSRIAINAIDGHRRKINELYRRETSECGGHAAALVAGHRGADGAKGGGVAAALRG